MSELHLMTADAVAERLNVRASTVRAWARRGWLRHVQLGKLLRFRAEDVAAFVEAQARGGRVA